MKNFRVWASVDRPAEEQGKIVYTCLNFRREPRTVQKKIRQLCREVGGEFEKALFVYLTTREDSPSVCRRYYLSERTLQRKAADFLARW